MQQPQFGIWAGPDIQVALTSGVALAYLRLPDCLVAGAYIRSDGYYLLRGVSASFWGSGWGSVAVKPDGRTTLQGDAPRMTELLKRSIPRELLFGHGTWFSNGPLELVESITVVDPYPGLAASRTSAGDRIVEWNLGTTIIVDPQVEDSFAIVLNAVNHWCIYENCRGADTFSVYCRCARIAASNDGIMFVQNVKMSVDASSGLNQCFMAPDNLEAARADLVVDKSKFDPSRCAFIGSEGREWATIYWSVKTVEPDRIVLHGCEGKEYTYQRPSQTHDKKEYFRCPIVRHRRASVGSVAV